MRVFRSSDIVDIPSDRLSVRTIPLYGCMDRNPRYNSRKAGRWRETGMRDKTANNGNGTGSGVARSGTEIDTIPGATGANTGVAAWHPYNQKEVDVHREWLPMGPGARRPGEQEGRVIGVAPGPMEEGT